MLEEKELLKVLVLYQSMGIESSCIYAVIPMTLDEYQFFSQCHGLSIGGTMKDTITQEQVNVQVALSLNLECEKLGYTQDYLTRHPYMRAWQPHCYELGALDADISSVDYQIVTVDYTPY